MRCAGRQAMSSDHRRVVGSCRRKRGTPEAGSRPASVWPALKKEWAA
jgi:hypothetical protein